MFTNNYGNEILYVKLKTFELNMAQSGKYKGKGMVSFWLKVYKILLNSGCGLFDCRPVWLQRFANGGFVVALMVGIRWGAGVLL